MSTPQISIVVPLFNEAESLPELMQRIHSTIDAQGWSYEVYFVDDGSTDGSWQILNKLSKKYTQIRAIRFIKNYGKTQALRAAFEKVFGEVVVTIDADLQDRPEEIPEMYRIIKEKGFDLVSGWKQDRKDAKFSKNIPSLLFNAVARKTSGVNLNDFNCGLKAYRKEVVKALDLHGDMHRYLPVLAKNEGYTRITENPIPHDARKYGKSKFGRSRFVRGFLDLITLWFVSKFLNRPMHLFGGAGTLVFLFGFSFAAYLGTMKLYHIHQNQEARLITDNPFFYISLTCMLLGAQLFLAGFLGEILIRRMGNKSNFRISDQINAK